MGWDDILEQDAAKRTWQAHLASGRVAHAYLLVGQDGIGKRRLALEMAKALNCSGAAWSPCGACATCAQIARGVHPDVHVVAPAGASEQVRIDDIRALLARIALRPFNARVQVAILTSAERLTEEAANSLLKVLEEPPSHTRFILTSAQVSRCLATVVSRCQLIRCHPLSIETIMRILVAGHGCPPQAAGEIARLCGGSASRAVDLAGRWDEHRRLLERLALGGAGEWIASTLPESRHEVARLLDGLLGWLRDVALASAAPGAEIAHAAYRDALRRQGQRVEVERCVEAAFEIAALRESLEQFANPRLVATLAREHWLSLIEIRHV